MAKDLKKTLEAGKVLYQRVLCPAKINLFLEITGRREDGYHTLDSMMQKVALCDVIELTLQEGEGVVLTTRESSLPTGEKNLAVRAALAYMEAADIRVRASITLIKRIPVAAGMAGGSTDAAGVLFAFQSLTEALTRDRLASVALSLGADVPFCLFHTAAHCSSLGEEFSPCRRLPDCHILIAKFNREAVSTKEAYRLLDTLSYEARSSSALLAALKEKNLAKTGEALFNRFEDVILPNCPKAEHAKAVMRDKGAFAALMSGSGPSVFGLFQSRQEADEACRLLRANGYFAVVTRPWR